MNKLMLNRGFSLLEILLSLGVFSLLIISVISLTLGSFSFFSAGQSADAAEAMVEEALAAVGAVSNRDWNELVFERSAVDASSGLWVLVGEGTTEQVNGFFRTIDFQTIFRDSSGKIVPSSDPGAEQDLFSKLVKISILWNSERGIPQSLDRTFLISKK